MPSANQARAFSSWRPSSDILQISSLDCHTGGEPLRIITAGFPVLPGKRILDKREYCQTHYDHLRTALMFEPRGHADMYGCLIVAAERADSDFGALFLHNEGYSTMCGHAIIALTRVALEAGVVASTGPMTTIKIDVPAGQITAYAEMSNGKVTRTYFDNVPSFVVALDVAIDVPEMGKVNVTLAYGGAYYAYVDAPSLGLSLAADNHRQIIAMGRSIKAAVQAQIPIHHPFDDELSFLYGCIFSAPSTTPGVHSRNVCIFADGELDRSPTGSGVSGQAAILHARGALRVGENIIIESILGSQFKVAAYQPQSYGFHSAIIPRVEGSAHVTGRSTFYLDPQDPLIQGFIFR
ncbi:proline racemase family protein [Undibacterium sp. Ji83W]|uniref:proline racemase family protein n=1 Tax=Undibacterium sp. Ji83W TaxID=3413043 RepID=UPI003BF42175